MPTIEQQNYVLNVVVKKLSVPPFPTLDPQDVLLQFDALNTPTTISQNLIQTSFIRDQTTDTQLISNQQNQNYGDKGFKLTIYEKDENDKRAGVVGECVCNWEMTGPEEWSEEPFERTCQLYKDGEFAGTVTLNVNVTRKCEDKSNEFSSKPLVKDDGKLTIFDDLKYTLNPKDVFFVVGDPPDKAGGDSNPLTSCTQGKPCRFDTDLTRYRVVQGKLVKDFSIIKDCENDECCALGNLFDEFKDIFSKDPPEPSSSKCSSTVSESQDKFYGHEPEEPSPSTDLYGDCEGDRWEDSPCGVLFGPLSKRSVGYKRKKKPSTSTSVHMPDCPVKLAKRKPSKKTDTICCSRSCSGTVSSKSLPSTSCPSTNRGTPTNVNSLVNRIVRTAKQCQQEQVPPRTCSAPKLVKSDFQIFPKSCPICCEDVSWLQPLAPCPKCGFKSKVGLPIEMTSYDENQTAKDVLERWKTDVEKHKRKKDINPLGVCLCNKNKECINCQIRRTSYKPAEGMPENVSNQLSVQKAVQRLAEAERSKIELSRKNMVTRIVEEVLGQPIKRPTMDIEKLLMKRDTEPDMAKAIQWARNQLPKRKKLLDSASNVSDHSRSSLLRILHKAAEDSGDEKTAKDKKGEKNKKVKEQERAKKKMVDKNRQGDTLHQCQAKYFEYCKRRDRYPPKVFGHYYCNPTLKPVPKNMGWYWNLDLQGERRGYRPGAIYRKTHKIMNFFKEKRAEAEEMARRKQCELAAKKLEKPKETELPHVHVKKHGGKYIVTAYPLCDPNLPADQKTEKMLPIEFTITEADEAHKRRQVKEYFRLVDQMRFDPDSINPDIENEQILRAVNNLKDLLRTETLRNILQYGSESDGSIDIDIGGGVFQKKIFKEDVGIQIEDDVLHPVSMPQQKGRYFKNPYTNTCVGPFDEMPSDRDLRPPEPIQPKKPKRRFIPPMIRPKPKKPPKREWKRPNKDKEENDDQGEKKKFPLKPFKPKPADPPRPGVWSEKIKTEKDKDVKQKDKDLKQKEKDAKIDSPKRKPGSIQRGSKVPPTDFHITAPKSERRSADKGTLDHGKKKRLSKREPVRKVETAPTDGGDAEEHHSAKRKSIIIPPFNGSKRPKKPKKEEDEKDKKSILLPPVILPPRRPSIKPPAKRRPPFEYNPSMFNKSKLKPCKWKEACRPSPLTTVKFMAHDCKDNCDFDTQPRDYSYVNMNMNEYGPYQNIADKLPFDLTERIS